MYERCPSRLDAFISVLNSLDPASAMRLYLGHIRQADPFGLQLEIASVHALACIEELQPEYTSCKSGISAIHQIEARNRSHKRAEFDLCLCLVTGNL